MKLMDIGYMWTDWWSVIWKILFEGHTFSAAAFRGSPHSMHKYKSQWDKQAWICNTTKKGKGQYKSFTSCKLTFILTTNVCACLSSLLWIMGVAQHQQCYSVRHWLGMILSEIEPIFGDAYGRRNRMCPYWPQLITKLDWQVHKT